MTYRILTLDGGGIRGVLTAELLRRLELARPGFLARFDLVAGTSTGGILAIALAKGLLPERIVQMYQHDGPQIFDASWRRDLTDLDGLAASHYSNAGLHRLLTEILGSQTLGELDRTVFVPSFQLDNCAPEAARRWQAVFMNNIPGRTEWLDVRAVDVAMRTSAAPTYFPSYQGFVDGGLVANDPSVAAICGVLDPRTARATSLDEISLLSLGTGGVLQYISGDNDWGDVRWVKPLLDILLADGASVADFQCTQLLRERYLRIQPVFPSGTNIPLDAVNRVPELLSIAEKVDLSGAIAWLDRWWMPGAPAASEKEK